VIGAAIFPQLLKNTPIALIHFGCILILAGSMWSSETGHAMQNRLLKEPKIYSGKMIIPEGKKTDLVLIGIHAGVAKLGFEIELKDFDVEYYEPSAKGMPAMPKEFTSNVRVIKDGKIVKSQKIEVNHPLHYGGYLIYQNDYDTERGAFTILKVTSDSGLSLVFGGYLFLCIGLFWQLWFKRTRNT
jgi:cytochrome c biogenesis protein